MTWDGRFYLSIHTHTQKAYANRVSCWSDSITAKIINEKVTVNRISASAGVQEMKIAGGGGGGGGARFQRSCNNR